MSINYVDNSQGKSNSSGCFVVILIIFSLVTAIVELTNVSGFWLRCGMFLTIMAGGCIGGRLGVGIGDMVGGFARPSAIFTQEGLWAIFRLKLFWMLGPQFIGMILGWALGIHLLLLIFWGMPLTALGKGNISFADNEKTPSLAERYNDIKTNIAFIDKMQNADIRTKRNMLLMVAIDADSVVTVEKLIAEGVDVNSPRIPLDESGLPYKGNNDALTPLWAAISYGFDRTQIALLLIKFGADVNVRNDKFKAPTPLLFVLRNNMTGLVIPLLEHGADVNVSDIDGKTPLHHAINKGMTAAALLMLDKGADPTLKDNFKHIPLDYADEDIRAIIQQKINQNKTRKDQNNVSRK